MAQFQQHGYEIARSISTPMGPMGFDAPVIDPGARIRAHIYEPPNPRNPSGDLGIKDNILIRTASHSAVSPLKHADGRDVKAYWIYKKIKKAIYGKVAAAFELMPKEGMEGCWIMTGKKVAVKMLLLEMINSNSNLAEDPIKEISAMQYLHGQHNGGVGGSSSSMSHSGEIRGGDNVCRTVEVLSDERYVYSVMPFLRGGELFDHVSLSGRFSEARARHWFKQILMGVQFLQDRGVCHRDMSLENLMVDEDNAIVIDMGMCVRIPYINPNSGARGHKEAVGVGGHRALISRQQRCGKPNYMSPEVYSSDCPFDGHAIDIWACGVILFIMLTGVPPFDVASTRDQRFNIIQRGGMVGMLRGWGMNMSEEAAGLIQGILRWNPAERLELNQVWEHPWMSGPTDPPGGF